MGRMLITVHKEEYLLMLILMMDHLAHLLLRNMGERFLRLIQILDMCLMGTLCQIGRMSNRKYLKMFVKWLNIMMLDGI